MSEYDDDYLLREHIRRLLLNYAREYLTTDYLQMTEYAVSQVLNSLTEIPTTDPHSLRLPTDPFETLSKMHGFDLLTPYEEMFTLPAELDLSAYLKRSLMPKAKTIKSERVAYEDPGEDFIPHEPFDHMLSRQARKATPHPGQLKFASKLPTAQHRLISTHSIHPTAVGDVKDPEVSSDEVLNVNFKLTSAEASDVSELLRASLSLSRPPAGRTISYLDFMGRPDSPALVGESQRDLFMPVFPRSERMGGGCVEPDVQSFVDVAGPLVKMEVEEESPLYLENMKAVDGWQTFEVSSSRTPSIHSSQNDELDELFSVSSPNTELSPVRAVELAKNQMDVPLIPRSRLPGRGPKKRKRDESFTSFVTSILPPTTPPKKVATPAPLQSSPTPSLSMVGQAPSALASIDFEDGLINELAPIYEIIGRTNPTDIIMKDRIDENSPELLMEVPTLPPPTQHKPHRYLVPALTISQFIVPPSMKPAPHLFLRKPKGIASLNVDLSWEPFVSTKLPTTAEVVGVSKGPVQDKEVEELLQAVEKILLFDPDPMYEDRRILDQIWKEKDEIVVDYDLYRHEIILTRAERRRLAGLPERSWKLEDKAFPDGDTVDVVDQGAAMIASADFLQDVEDEMSDKENVAFANTAKFPQLDDDGAYLDDSGVGFGPPDDASGAANYANNYDHRPATPFAGREDYYSDDGGADQSYALDTSYIDNTRSAVEDHFAGYDEYQEEEDFDPQYRYDGDERFEALSFSEGAAPYRMDVDRNPDETPLEQVGILPLGLPASNNTSMELPSRISDCILASKALGIDDFARLRARKITQSLPPPPEIAPVVPESEPAPQTIPQDVYDRNTLRLPADQSSSQRVPLRPHRYLASLDLLQKQILTRNLRSQSIDLVERDTLSGVDIIFDPNTAAICHNLLALPSQCERLTKRLSEQSWRFDRLLIVLEAHQPSLSYRNLTVQSSSSSLFAYSPPVLRAIKKLRRDLGLAEGMGKKREECLVTLSFANTVEEAAKYVRMFGELAEAADQTSGVIWGDRAWLDEDIPEDEESLGLADGMNSFAAYLILCQVSLNEFLETSEEERVKRFGSLIGAGRMNTLNGVIRRQAAELAESEVGSYLPG